MPAVVVDYSKFAAGVEPLFGWQVGIVRLNLIPKVEQHLVYFRSQHLYVGKCLFGHLHRPLVLNIHFLEDVEMRSHLAYRRIVDGQSALLQPFLLPSFGQLP